MRQTELIKFIFFKFAPDKMPTDIQLTYAIQDFNRDHPVHLKEYESGAAYPITKETRGGFNGKIKK